MPKTKRISAVLPGPSAERFDKLKETLGFDRDVDVIKTGTRLLESYAEVFENDGMLILRDKDGNERPYLPLIALGR